MSAPDNQPPTRLCCGKPHLGVVCPDDKVMCSLCFERVAQDELNTASDGQKENACKACALAELSMKIVKNRTAVEEEPEETDDAFCEGCYWEGLEAGGVLCDRCERAADEMNGIPDNGTEESVGAEPEETVDDEGLICPYCGKLDRDAWELTRDAECGETECGTCGREFRWSTFTQTTYFGYPIAKEEKP